MDIWVIYRDDGKENGSYSRAYCYIRGFCFLVTPPTSPFPRLAFVIGNLIADTYCNSLKYNPSNLRGAETMEAFGMLGSRV